MQAIGPVASQLPMSGYPMDIRTKKYDKKEIERSTLCRIKMNLCVNCAILRGGLIWMSSSIEPKAREAMPA
jgi:hypothetical protein